MKTLLRSVVLIDDAPANNLLMEIFLREELYFQGECVALTSMPEGVQHFQQLIENQASFPELVLLDVNMPGKGGFDLLNVLQEETVLEGQPTQVIMFSAVVQANILAKAQAYPFVITMVEKGFDNEELRQVIEEHFYWT